MLRKLFGKATLKYCRRLSNLIMAKRYDQACLRADQDIRKFCPRSSKYLELQIAEGGAYHKFASYKLWELSLILRKHKPNLIVELGSGSTTAAFAEYAELNTDCTVISVDEYKPYHQAVFDRLQKSGFAPNNRVHQCYCPKIVETRNGVEATRYEPRYTELFMDTVPDLVYVDGPTTNHPDKPGIALPCIDVIYLCESGILPRSIVYDYRLASVRALLATGYCHQYDAYLHHSTMLPEQEPWVVGPVRHHSQLFYNGVELPE
jgi:hypothetical protein